MSWDESAISLIPMYLAALQRDESASGVALRDFCDFAESSFGGPVSRDVGIAFCRLVKRAVDSEATDIEEVVWALQALCQHPDMSVAALAIAILFRIRPDMIASLDWLEATELARIFGLSREPELEESLRLALLGGIESRLQKSLGSSLIVTPRHAPS